MDLLTIFLTLFAGTSAIAICAFGANRVLRKSAASLRHLIWLAAFGAMIVFPIARLVLPGVKLVVAHKEVGSGQIAISRSREASSSSLAVGNTEEASSAQLAAGSAVGGTTLADTGLNDAAPATTLPPRPKTTLPAVGFGVAIWGLGALLCCAQIGMALARLKRLRTTPADSSLAEQQARWVSRIGVRRCWQLRVNVEEAPPVAMTWGAVNSTVLLPDTSSDWTQQRLEAVMLHELAHVRRWDCASQLMTAAVCALYWFNPLVWLGARAMRAEAESAADDIVLGSGYKPSAYAGELLRLAAELGNKRQPCAVVGVSLMKHSKIESRVVAILDSSRRRRGVGSLEAISILTFALVMAAPLATLRPVVAPAEPKQSLAVSVTQTPPVAPPAPAAPAVAALPALPALPPGPATAAQSPTPPAAPSTPKATSAPRAPRPPKPPKALKLKALTAEQSKRLILLTQQLKALSAQDRHERTQVLRLRRIRQINGLDSKSPQAYKQQELVQLDPNRSEADAKRLQEILSKPESDAMRHAYVVVDNGQSGAESKELKELLAQYRAAQKPGEAMRLSQSDLQKLMQLERTHLMVRAQDLTVNADEIQKALKQAQESRAMAEDDMKMAHERLELQTKVNTEMSALDREAATKAMKQAQESMQMAKERAEIDRSMALANGVRLQRDGLQNMKAAETFAMIRRLMNATKRAPRTLKEYKERVLQAQKELAEAQKQLKRAQDAHVPKGR